MEVEGATEEVDLADPYAFRVTITISSIWMKLVHVVVGVTSYAMVSITFLLSTPVVDTGICVLIGVGFGQLTMLAVWMAMGKSTRIGQVLIAATSVTIALLLLCGLIESHIDLAFYLLMPVAALVYLGCMFGSFALLRNTSSLAISRGSEAAIDSRPIQYGIRELMIAMLVVSLLAAFFSFLLRSSHGKSVASDYIDMAHVLGLIICFYLLLSWPVIVACLSLRDVIGRAVLALLLSIAIIWAQKQVFDMSLGRGNGPGEYYAFLALDLPLLVVVVAHSLIARCYGYRMMVARNP